MRGLRVAAWLMPLALLASPLPVRALGSWVVKNAAGSERAPRPAAPPPASLARIDLVDHRVQVRLQDGFATTEVLQTWRNATDAVLEARYQVPLPRNASLSEMTITAGDLKLSGEVRRREEAERIYEEETNKGSDAGVARKDEYRQFEFAVSRVPAQASMKVRLVYYQPLAIDTGVARYVYPVAAGGNEETATSFWNPNVKGEVPVDVTIGVRSSWPVEEMHLPGLANALSPKRQGPGELEVSGRVDTGKDIVAYYRLAGDLPGRVEVVPYRASSGPGTFMAVLTPGVQLAKLSAGADLTFVLDTSGSMRGALDTLVRGVERALGSLKPGDRFRIITFSTTATNHTPQALPGTPEGIQRGVEILKGLHSDGSTDLFAGLQMALAAVDPERTTQILLVTDGVANHGIVDPAEFARRVRATDVRVHGFLMGNESNWPLMETITRASGGHFQCVSVFEDIHGLLALTRDKLTSEALHDVRMTWSGVEVTDVTEAPTRIYHGQQVVLFGRYAKPGRGRLTINAKISGKEHVWATDVELPEANGRTPELERLWALVTSEELELKSDAGLVPSDQAKQRIAELGVAAQIVTDETSMVLLTDGQFAARGIRRENAARVAVEHRAQAARAAAPPVTYQVHAPAPARPHTPTWSERAPSFGGGRGGGAIDPLSAIALIAMASFALARREERM